MLGAFQSSCLRVEISGTAQTIQSSLIRPEELRQWLWPQRFQTGMPERLQVGDRFQSWFGPIPIEHDIQRADPRCLRSILSGGIDGYHEWYWGDGWVQSCLEGISAFPIKLANTTGLLRLRAYVRAQHSGWEATGGRPASPTTNNS